MKFIAATARRIKPDCFIAGELVLDSRSPLLDETHGYGYAGIHAPTPTDPDAQRNTPPPEYYIFTRYLMPQSFSGIGHVHGRDDLMNGTAGSHANKVWRENRKIFESPAGATPCRTSPRGVLAYLYGPVDGKAVLAVRATCGRRQG
jgi:hypothetical protein